MIRPHLIKWIAAICVLECVGAATLPSSPAPEFGAATINGSGSEEGSPGQKKDPPPSTRGCSDEIKAMAAELESINRRKVTILARRKVTLTRTLSEAVGKMEAMEVLTASMA